MSPKNAAKLTIEKTPENLKDVVALAICTVIFGSAEKAIGHFESHLVNYINQKFGGAYLKAESKEELERLKSLYSEITGGEK